VAAPDPGCRTSRGPCRAGPPVVRSRQEARAPVCPLGGGRKWAGLRSISMPELTDADPGPVRRAAMLLIVTEDGALLLHHRDDKPGIPNPDCWAGFGGAVEDGETVADAVLREVREETGLQITDPIFLTEAVDHEGDGRTVSLFYIVGAVRPEDIDLNEGAGVGVHRIEDLPDLKMTPFVRRAIYSHLVPVIANATAARLSAFMAGTSGPPIVTRSSGSCR
jgi:8-oxo-dGTP pyrophosphatase MutT (NUDIX family)